MFITTVLYHRIWSVLYSNVTSWVYITTMLLQITKHFIHIRYNHYIYFPNYNVLSVILIKLKTLSMATTVLFLLRQHNSDIYIFFFWILQLIVLA